MLERELRGIRSGHGNDPLVDGLRSGRRRSASMSDDNHQNVLGHAHGSSVGTANEGRGRRRRSASLSGDNRLNSTSNNSVVTHTAEYSSIVRPGNIPRRTIDMHDSYIESPIGGGAGTRGIRTSEDDYEADADVVQEDFEDLYEEVDKFGCEHINREGWKNSVEAEFKRIDVKILQFMQKLGLVGGTPTLKRARSLRSTLQNYRVTLTKRVRDEMENPIFSEVNLTAGRTLDGHSISTDSSSNTTSTISENTGCTERENQSVKTTDNVFSDWCESNSQQSEDQHQALLPSNVQRPSAIPERMQGDQIGDTPIRSTARKQSVNLISLIDCEKEKDSLEKETSLHISISGILKELNWPDFFENNEARERIATFDSRIEEMLTQMKTSIEENQKHNTDLASKVMSLTGTVTSQAESHKKMVETMNVKVKEHQSLRDDVSALQSDYKSLSSGVSSVKQQILKLKAEITENQESQNSAVDGIKETVNSALDKNSSAFQDTQDLKTQIETLKAVLKQNTSDQNDAIESIVQSIDKLKDDSDSQGVNIDALRMGLRDQKKKIHQVLTSTAHQEQSSDSYQPRRPDTNQMMRKMGNTYEDSPTLVINSGDPNSNGKQRSANSNAASEVTIVGASQSCQTERTPHCSLGQERDTRQGNINTLLVPEIVHTNQMTGKLYNQLRDATQAGKSVFVPETVKSGPVSSTFQSTDDIQVRGISKESDMGNANYQEEDETAQTIEQENLDSLVSQLNLLIALQVTKSSSEDLIKESKNRTIPAIVKLIPMVFNARTKYISYGNADRETCRRAKKATKDANDWIENVTKLYNESEIYTMNNSRTREIKIETFTGNGPQTIYEFFKDFNKAYRGKGSEAERADTLYSYHLSDRIKSVTSKISSDFTALKSFLLKKYGDHITVTETLLQSAESLAKPSREDFAARAEYFLKLETLFQKFDDLKDQDGINKGFLTEYVQSETTMKRLVELLPPIDMGDYTKKLRCHGLDTMKIMGSYAYAELSLYCANEGDAMNKVSSSQTKGVKSNERSKGRGVHNAQDASEYTPVQTSTSTTAIHTVQRKKEQGRKSTFPTYDKKWANDKWITPCGLNDHDHEVSKCKEFFTLTPAERRDHTVRRICWTCLGPRHKCRQEVTASNMKRIFCSNYQKVKPLVCKDCLEYNKSTNAVHPPPNILLCAQSRHQKPSTEDIARLVKDYLPSFDTTQPILVGFVESPSVNASLHLTKTRSVKQSEHDITINTQTGEKKEIDLEKITLPLSNPPVYITQWLQIGTSKCLCFFDTGANINMIDGGIAEKEGLRVITDHPTTLKVVGGSELVTDYGKYMLNIGPTPESDFKQLICHGMTSVAGPFPKVDLTEVNKEIRSTHIVTQDEKLPDYVSGSIVHLLIGISESAIQPVHVSTLPSGLSIYRSPFTDIFGSNICYGGTYESPFPTSVSTTTNQQVHLINSLQAAKESLQMHTMEIVKEYESDLLPLPIYDDIEDVETRKIHYTYEIGKEITTEIFPTPLTSKDFLDAGCFLVLENEIPEIQENSSTHQTVHWCSVNKAMVPIARLREIIDQDDIGEVVAYRCSECSKCIKCKESGKSRAVTLQESMEQEIIEKSVTIDREKRKVFVDLPFTKDPVPFLTKRHRASDNLRSAKEVYDQQCRQPQIHKEEMRKAHKELVNRGFMIKLSDLDEKTQKLITDAPFRHYYPWRTVEKSDSVSTPIRMVVDPTRTGLNLVLAKGENRLGKMNEILLRNRVKTHAWSSDISKMYNQLQLNESSYPYSLFLYEESLDSKVEPHVWVMLVAWYGVVPTGNQAGYSIERLANEAGESFKSAKPTLLNDRFVDDLATGARSKEARDAQVQQCSDLLASGGFSLKFVAKSGENPCEKASSNGESLKMLGYRWTPREDTLSPGISEMNFNKKIRGSKKPNVKPVVTKEDASDLMGSVSLTRKKVASKVAEIYDPIGIWEPLKLQFKLELSALNYLGWDETLDEGAQVKWKSHLLQLIDIPELQVDRCVIPKEAVLESGARLICLSDAAEHAGGVAIYICFKLQDGTYSSRLLTAKSKLMNATIPRNELSAIMLMTEIAYITVKALEDLVSEVIYITDSTIALSWCHNVNKKLRVYVHSRVTSIRRMIEWTTGEVDDLPLYHIDGKMNIADLLTKKHSIKVADLDNESEWQAGLPWMLLSTVNMPLKRYSDLKLDNSNQTEMVKECYQEPFNFHVAGSSDADIDLKCPQGCYSTAEDVYVDALDIVASVELDHGSSNNTEGQVHFAEHKSGGNLEEQTFIVDLISLGWQRARSSLSATIHAFGKWYHVIHSKSSEYSAKCFICQTKQLSQSELCSALMAKVEEYLFKRETALILATTTEAERKKFVLKDDVLFYSGRLDDTRQFSSVDLDLEIFFDNLEFTGLCPVVRSSSPLYFAYVVYIHMRVRPHSGVEITLREVMKKMYVPDSPRKVIKKVRNACVKCRIMTKKTLELEMSKHHSSRTMLAPVFYNCQMDVVFGFKGQSYKRSRSTYKLYALVIVCLLTSATSILALEGMETQDIILAIERHSARHGVPAELFVDNGTQLVALQSATMSLRNVDAHLYDSMGMRITVSSPKAHEQRGRVEAKVKLVREMLEKTGVDTNHPLTSIQWETVFAKVANALDDLPMAKGNSSNVSDVGFEILTPNRLKLGRNNQRSLQGSIRLENSALPSDILNRNRKITSACLQILIDRIHHFHHKSNKWLSSSDNPPKVDDIVLFVATDGNITSDGKVWKLGRVVFVTDSSVRIMYPNKAKPDKIPTCKFVCRSWREVCVVFSDHEMYLNSNEFFNSINEDAPTTQKCHE